MKLLAIRVSKACLTIAIITAFFTTVAQSQPVSTASDLVKKVDSVVLPKQPYTVHVSQSVETIASGPIKMSEGKVMADVRVSGKVDFDYAYDPESGLRMDHTKNNRLGKNTNLSEGGKNDIKIAVDFSRLFKNSSNWKNIQIVSNKWNEKACYKMTAEEGRINFEIWVDATNYFVPRIALKIDGRDFAELDISYRNVNSVYWLPERITIHHDIDGSRVIQDFSQYTF